MFLPSDYARMMELLKQQKAFLKDFLEITTSLPPLIENEDSSPLQKALDDRQAIIGRVEGLCREANPLLGRYHALTPYSQKGMEEKKAASALQDEIQGLLAQIESADQKNQEEVRGRMEYYKAEMLRVKNTKEGAKAYTQGAAVFGSEHFDGRS